MNTCASSELRGGFLRVSVVRRACGFAGLCVLAASVGLLAGDLRNVTPLAMANLTSSDAPVAHETIAATTQLQVEPIDIADGVRYFNGRAIRPVKTLTMIVTAYSPDSRSCGNFADGITASGYSVWTNGMKLAAADTSILPFGSLITVPGYDGDNVVPVLDRGGAIKGNRLDMLYPTHEIARQWGRQKLTVTVWEYVD
ncbi:MAG: 3D domain-containing protein [Phycisphaerales bacterium]|nr:3D domain-containing protein [Phycisphaerales bacterium]